MKATIIFIIGIFLSISVTQAQVENKIDLSEEQQSENETNGKDGYSDSSSMKTVFQIGVYRLDSEYYPKASVTIQEIFGNVGVYFLGEYSKMVLCQEWADAGYNLDERLYVSANIGLSYLVRDCFAGKVKVIAGMGFGFHKLYFGPFMGLNIDKGKLSFKAMGLYSVTSAYTSEYPEETVEMYGDRLIHIDGADPNSWYKVSLGYSVTKNIKVGIISERFYASGLFAALELKGRSMKFNVKGIAGKNFENNQNCYGLAFGLDF